MTAALRVLRALWRDRSGVALVEFAYAAPVLITLTVGGAEIANYATVKMRVSQLAIHVSDNASRIGEGDPLAARRITETQINDLLTGAGIQAGTLNIFGTFVERSGGADVTRPRGRIIISNLEPMVAPVNTGNRYKITWQRCRGLATTYTPQYGTVGQASGTNMVGMGPAGRQVTAPDGTAVIFVEVHYRYEPLFIGQIGIIPYENINAVSAMTVRNDRDLTQIYNSEGAAVSSC